MDQYITLKEIRNNTLYKEDYEVWDEKKNEWVDYKNSCYCTDVSFPNPKDAKYPVILITIYNSLTDQYDTWGVEKEYTPKSSNVRYHRCNSESELFEKFMNFWKADPPDIFTGWNCIEENQSVWLEDRIVRIKDLSSNYENRPLKKHGTSINKYMQTGIKEEFEIKTQHGDSVLCSKDHRFMVYIKEKDKYKNFNTLTKEIIELSVEGIECIQKTHDVYVKKTLGENTNNDLTYGELFKELDFDRNNLLEETDDVLKFNFTTKKRDSDSFFIKKKEVISKDILQLIGYIFTDGTYDRNLKTFRYTCKYKNVVEAYTEIFNNEHSKHLTLSLECNTKFKDREYSCYAKQLSLNTKLGVLMHMIYNSEFRKQPNIELLSRLSYTQFISFLSGMIDGDGWIENYGISLCNYDCKKYNFLLDLSNLMLWNGMQTRVFDNYITLNSNEINCKHIQGLRLFHTSRRDKIKQLIYKKSKNSISKNIQWMIGKGEYVVRLEPVKRTGRLVNMCDIETQDHVFLCNGILTHNCEQFDIPYIINRGRKLLNDEFINQLSPLRKLHYREFRNDFGQETGKWIITGISCIDYMDLYKKFSKGDRESYSLNYISEYELKEGKLAINATNLSNLAETDWENFVDYNIQDVNLLIKLDEKLNYLNIVRLLAYKGCTNFESALGKIAIVTGAMSLQAGEQEYVIPTFVNEEIRDSLAGGFVKDPVRGLHESIVSFDVNSLYPNTIITLNISSETKLGKIVTGDYEKDEKIEIKLVNGKVSSISTEKFKEFIKKEKVAVSKAGVLYSQKFKGVCPNLINKIYAERVEAKKKMKDLQHEKRKIEEELKRLKE